MKEAVTKVNMRTVREAGDEKEKRESFTLLFPWPQAPTPASLRSPTRSGPSTPRTRSFAARICCQKYKEEFPAEEARFK